MKLGLKAIGVFSFIFFSFLVSGLQVYAGSTYSGVVYNTPLSATFGACQDAVCNQAYSTGSYCYNSEAVGVTNCGMACPAGAGSSAWTKYQFAGCQIIEKGSFGADDTCATIAQEVSAVYSTADKCTPSDGASYLRGGNCSGAIGGIYKTCCNDSGGGMASQSCVQVQPYSGAPFPPYDGVCPSGSHSVTCGYAGAEKPTCGPSACSAAPTATPSPTPTAGLCISGDPCTAGEVNTKVCSGSGVTKTCYNFGGTYCWWPTTCSAGTTCSSGNCVVGCANGSTQSICIQSTTCNL